MKHSFLIVILLLCFGCQIKNDIPKAFELHDNWQFKKVNDSSWLSATIPGNVHSDLLDNKIIENPFIGDNELKLQWISDNNWEYKTLFSLNNQIFKKKHIELNFEGLDTYASVFLNDSLILKTNNAFRHWKVDVKPFLKQENELRILFKKISKFENQEKSQLPYELPGGNRVFTRKAQFQYGWDWAPTLNTFGIWKGVYLKAWDDTIIDEVFIAQGQHSIEKATFYAELKISSQLNSEAQILTEVNGVFFKENIGLHEKTMVYTIPITIENPKLWWPHNLGKPHLYDISFKVIVDGKVVDEKSVRHGIRRIDLITEKDSIGESFYFKVNGVPIYTKGANYIPQNSFQNKITDAHYEKLLNDVVEANMNILRVWGGGIYENDIFYDLCDEKGILVWQDFMFAGAMYPGDEVFLENVKQEATNNVKRLRNHASIALWCGNNENSEGWHRWGWQSGKTEEQKKEIWNNYQKIFDDILPLVVAQHSETDYWESSPKYGRGNPKYRLEGDAHDWWIWHDGHPFERLENNVPRFMSEFGFQSFPSYETIKYINQSDSVTVSSEAFKIHQKHSRGFKIIEDYMKLDFPVPNNTEDYIYVSQLLQAHGIIKGIEAHRRAKPYNMGTLYWQLNDCWPAVSWSSIDFFGNWKALHYKVKNAFKNVLISSVIENDIMKIYIVNDDLKLHQGQLSIKIIDFNGKELWQHNQEVIAKPNSSELKFSIPLKSLKLDKNAVVIISEFNTETSYSYLVKPKELVLNRGKIEKKLIKTSTGFQIELSSSTFQKDVFLYTNAKGHFSENFFNLLPNKTKIIYFKTEVKLLNDLKIKTFNSLIR